MKALHVWLNFKEAVQTCCQNPAAIERKRLLLALFVLNQLLLVVRACLGEMQAINVLIRRHRYDLLAAGNSADTVLMHAPRGEFVLTVILEMRVCPGGDGQLNLAGIKVVEERAKSVS